MSGDQSDQNVVSAGTVIFWLLWVAALVLLPLYGFTLAFDVNVMREGNLGSQISPVIGIAVFIAQIIVMVKSFKQKKQDLPLSKPYLTLLGGTIIIALMWVGGCSIMGPWSMH